MFKNYRLSSAEGLSPLFLIIWFLGDFSNLGGCVLGNYLSTTQVCLSTQTIQAVYFLIIDIILCSQWVWYSKLRKARPKDDEDPLIEDTNAVELAPVSSEGEPGDKTATLPVDAAKSENNETSTKPALLVLLPLIAVSFFAFASPFSAHKAAPLQRSLLEESAAENTTAIVFAQIVAWVSTVMYLACRIPQIVRNVRDNMLIDRSPTSGSAAPLTASL